MMTNPANASLLREKRFQVAYFRWGGKAAIPSTRDLTAPVEDVSNAFPSI
jgi:hypothetical protein